MYITNECPICKQEFRDHSGKIGFTLRKHFAFCHPEADKEMREAEEKIRDITKGIRSKYPNVHFW